MMSLAAKVRDTTRCNAVVRLRESSFFISPGGHVSNAGPLRDAYPRAVRHPSRTTDEQNAESQDGSPR
jgi:hypothetical protein